MTIPYTTDEFIEKASIKHNNVYTYNNTIYTGNAKVVTITCPIHGDFEQVAKTHLQGKGCKACGDKRRCDFLRNPKQKFIDKAIKVHGNKYIYTKVEYKNNNEPVVIICKEHGEFLQRPRNHTSGQGCMKCRDAVKTVKFIDFISRSNITHSNKYSYSQSKYVNAVSQTIITCPIHGEFTQVAAAHMSGQGCPMCAKTGFDNTKPAILYYLKVNGGKAYKIGITNRTVNERFTNSELQQIEILATRYYEVGQDAYDAEQQVLKDYKEFKYTGPDILVSGNTELFTKDILDIDPMYLYK